MQRLAAFLFIKKHNISVRSYIILNKSNLRHNYFEIKTKARKEIISVIKANAYGHGIKEISKELSYMNCPFFVVASLQEAITTRKNLIYVPILLLENTSDLRVILSLKITLAITSMEQLVTLSSTNYPIMIQLCINIGMNREGILPEEVPVALEIIKKSKLKLMGIYGHHSGPNKYEQECKELSSALSSFEQKIFFHHKATPTLSLKDINEQDKYLRIGGALYGLTKIDGFDLKPVLFLNAPICYIKEIEENTPIGYDDGSLSKTNGILVTIPFGYGDGWPKRLNILCYYKGKIYHSCGGRMMNHTLFIFDKESDPKIGDDVELIGTHLNVFDLAKEYDMIPYEVTTLLSSQLKRIVEK